LLPPLQQRAFTARSIHRLHRENQISNARPAAGGCQAGPSYGRDSPCRSGFSTPAVVDVRSNGGGNISQWIIERLDTVLLGTRFGNASDEPRTYPNTVFHGHKVCLINETSASDGDIFPRRFKDAGLGPLIGKRTWGGVVGISGIGPLLDGGNATVPLQATNDVNGNYIVEGEGVPPDIEVENDPASVLAGHDPQLERGIEEVLKAIAAKPMKPPKRPADPVKTK
jgi:tricorn protease